MPALPGVELKVNGFAGKDNKKPPALRELQDNSFIIEELFFAAQERQEVFSCYLSMTGIGVSSLSSKWLR